MPTRHDVNAGLPGLDAFLSPALKLAEIAMHDGIAATLRPDAMFHDEGLGAIVESGGHNAFGAAIAEFARRCGWLRCSVDEAVSANTTPAAAHPEPRLGRPRRSPSAGP